jgi:small subunit ribosomal protein S9
MSQQYYYANGKRKTAVARVRLYPNGSGKIEINGKPAEEFFTVKTQLPTVLEPFKYAGGHKAFDMTVRVVGGGDTGQADAIRHGAAKALVELNPELRGDLKHAGFLTRDSRRVERKKPGLKKARRSPQWSKR